MRISLQRLVRVSNHLFCGMTGLCYLAEGHIGKELYLRIADIALRLYTTAAEYALSRGLIADTKFEFGICVAFKQYLRF